MADVAPRLAVPVDYQTLDEAVHDSGAPMSSWLGQTLARRDRFLLAHSRRSFSMSYGAGVAYSSVRGSVAGPFDVVGTADAWTAEWALIADLDYGESAIVAPVILSPRRLPPRSAGRWAQTIAGTGSAEFYGPFEAPHLPGSSRIGLAIWPAAGSGAATENGTVYSAQGTEIVPAVPFVNVAAGWVIRILDSTGTMVLMGWTEVDHVRDWGGVVGAYCEIVTPLETTFRDADKVLWEAKEADGRGVIHTVAWREVPQ